jgi:hypothetical protein
VQQKKQNHTRYICIDYAVRRMLLLGGGIEIIINPRSAGRGAIDKRTVLYDVFLKIYNGKKNKLLTIVVNNFLKNMSLLYKEKNFE